MINYEEKLKASLMCSANMTVPQAECVAIKYRVAVARGGEPLQVLTDMIQSYSNETIEEALNRILNEKISVDKNSQLETLRSDIHKFEHNVNEVLQAEVILNEHELANLSKHQRADFERYQKNRKAGIHVNIPKRLQPNYESTATYSDSSKGLELEVITHGP